MRPNLWRLAAIIALVVPLASASYAAQQTIVLQPGDTLDASCASELSGSFDPHAAHLACAIGATTATPAATAVPTTGATATPAPVAGQLCPPYVHAAIVTNGPDGLPYPTWHPPVDSVSGCYFGHEHGDDPSSSLANSDPPAFGYVGQLGGMMEPHTGFKVFVIPAGVSTDVGPTRADSRIVFHHGTAGVGRYITQFHSLEYDYIARDGTGREFHIAGMADSQPNSQVGSTCSSPRLGGRDFGTLGCADPYEIWNNVHFNVAYPGDFYNDAFNETLYAEIASALFDPITTRDPADNSRLLYTSQVQGQPEDPLSAQSGYRGCRREIYSGPNYFRNAGQPTAIRTDVMGHYDPSGPLLQRISAVTNTQNDSFKTPSNHCTATIRSPN